MRRKTSFALTPRLGSRLSVRRLRERWKVMGPVLSVLVVCNLILISCASGSPSATRPLHAEHHLAYIYDFDGFAPAGSLLIRPADFAFSGDGSAGISGLRWRGWGSPVAVGRGQFRVKAETKKRYPTIPARVVASDLTVCAVKDHQWTANLLHEHTSVRRALIYKHVRFHSRKLPRGAHLPSPCHVPLHINNELLSVSCPTLEFCMTVGYSDGYSRDFSLAETWNGATWRISKTGFHGEFNAVSCPTTAFCMAVGGLDEPSATYRNLAVVWNGTKWRRLPVPPGPKSTYGLYSVACPTRRMCMALGGLKTDAWTWNGRGWHKTRLPSGGGFDWSPCYGNSNCLSSQQVTCTSSSFCVAVTDRGYSGLHGSDQLVAAAWNGKRWRRAQAAAPRRTDSVMTNGISCTSRDFCIVVGAYGNRNHAFAERWDGRSWRPVRSEPFGNGPNLASVACAGPHHCVAVGNFGDLLSSRPVSYMWNGRQWRIRAYPSVQGSLSDAVNAVSCPAPDACVAVGDVDDPVNLTRPHSAFWNGTRWAKVPTPLPVFSP